MTVCSGLGNGALAVELKSALEKGERGLLLTAIDSFALPASAPDLLVQVVAPGELPVAHRQVSRLQPVAPGCSVMVVAVGLSESELGGLLAAGASDFVRAPVDRGELMVRVHRALGLPAVGVPAPGQPSPQALRGLIGDHPAFAQQVARVPLLARYDASVLILGDTGTGKEVCAQAIHYLSPRIGGPWVAVNCGAIPTELIEAELFGHVKGAYTHAHTARPGLIREAEGGTLFLDEIDLLPYRAQAKLLRFLQEKEYRPIGANAVAHANVRVIAASNRRPAQLASGEVFRQDLLFRLNVLTLHLPRLRDRASDIPQLALYFLRGAARQWQKAMPGLAPTALRKLLAYEWPGNVRELKNVMERAVLMSGPGPLTAQDIDIDGDAVTSASVGAESFRAAKASVVENFERNYIEQLLASNGGNVTHAAQAAQKNRRAFFELMRKHKIDADPFRVPPAS